MRSRPDPSKYAEICAKRMAGTPISHLSSEYSASPTQIGRILSEHNIKIDPIYFRLYSFDYNFFSIIDSEEKAYLLGFLYADGHNNTTNGSVRIELQYSDIGFIESIAKLLKFTGPIKKLVKKCAGKEYFSAKLQLNNRAFSNRCIELGMDHDKSFLIRFPSEKIIPKNLLRHFVRGYFDGDGSISFNPKKSRYAIISIIGNKHFINSLRQYFEQEAEVRCSTYWHNNKKSRYIGINGNQQVARALEHLYTNCSIFLPRKMEKYILLKSLLREFSRKKSCASKYFGVTATKEGTWRSIAYVKRVSHYLGTFKTEIEAAKAYDNFCLQNNHNLTRINFPPTTITEVSRFSLQYMNLSEKRAKTPNPEGEKLRETHTWAETVEKILERIGD